LSLVGDLASLLKNAEVVEIQNAAASCIFNLICKADKEELEALGAWHPFREWAWVRGSSLSCTHVCDANVPVCMRVSLTSCFFMLCRDHADAAKHQEHSSDD